MVTAPIRTKFALIAALCGALGVASGYAIFLIHGEIEERPWHFAAALFGAAIVSYVIEWLRDLIRNGEIEVETHPIIRSIGTFVVVLMFELFISGFHAGFDMGSNAVLRSAAALLGPDASVVQGIPWTVVLVAGIWVVAGALLAGWLTARIGLEDSPTPARTVLRSSGWGVTGGMIIAPLVIGVYIFCGRCLVMLQYFVQSTPASAAAHTSISGISGMTTSSQSAGPLILLDIPLEALRVAASHGMGVFWTAYGGLFVAIFVLLAWGDKRQKKGGLPPVFNFLLAGAAWGVFEPLVRSTWVVFKQLMAIDPLKAIFGAMLLGAIIWGIPGMLLGALVPLLRRAGRTPQSWALIGYGAAALLVLACILTRHAWPLIPALIALGSGILFQRGMPVKEFWPFAALCVAIGISGAMSVSQSITFRGVLLKLHAIDELHPDSPRPPEINLSALHRHLSTAEVRLDESSSNAVENTSHAAEENPEQSAKILEVAISGSVGFWTTVGLLACWSMFERE